MKKPQIPTNLSQTKQMLLLTLLLGSLGLSGCGGGGGGSAQDVTNENETVNNDADDSNTNSTDQSDNSENSNNTGQSDNNEGSNNSPSSSAPSKPTVSLNYASPKTLTFTWDTIENASHYTVQENVDGNSGFTTLTDDLAEPRYHHSISVHQRLNAQYIVSACNDQGCTDSDTIIPGNDISQAIGYVKASNTFATFSDSGPYFLGNEFGYSVALSDDGTTLAIGAISEQGSSSGVDGNETQVSNQYEGAGAVYVYALTADGWEKQAYIRSAAPNSTDEFGRSISLSADGNLLAVGVPYEDNYGVGVKDEYEFSTSQLEDDTKGFRDDGAVYLYQRNNNGQWSAFKYFKADGSQLTEDRFGFSVALSGDGSTLAVGVPMQDRPGGDSGAVYVFADNNGTWAQQGNYLLPNSMNSDDRFGFSVALSHDGNTLAASAINEIDPDTNPDQVFVYTRTADNWTQQQQITPNSPTPGDEFGATLALSSDGNTLAIGAPLEDGAANGIKNNDTGADNSTNDSGAAYIYTRTDTTWTQQAYIKPDLDIQGDGHHFGSSLALANDGNTLIVGAQQDDSSATGIGGDANDPSGNQNGAAYVFTRENNTWQQAHYLKARNGESNDHFGSAAACSADCSTIAIGADGEASNATGINGDETNNDANHAGAVYLY